jgi:hypothetical protein
MHLLATAESAVLKQLPARLAALLCQAQALTMHCHARHQPADTMHMQPLSASLCAAECMLRCITCSPKCAPHTLHTRPNGHAAHLTVLHVLQHELHTVATHRWPAATAKLQAAVAGHFNV